MTFEEFVKAALAIDPNAEVYEREGLLCIDTGYFEVGGPDVPLGYSDPNSQN